MGVLACAGIAKAVLRPALQLAQQQVQRKHSSGHLAEIGLAIQEYHDRYDKFPPAYTVDAGGCKLHSWRVLILPYLEQQTLYEQIDLTKPWDDPVNRRFESQMPDIYNVYAPGPTATSYLVVVGPETAFPESSSTRLATLVNKDGSFNTIAVVEVSGSTVPWMQPVDLEFSKMSFGVNTAPGNSISSDDPAGAHVVMCDGGVCWLSSKTPSEDVRALLTAAGGVHVADPLTVQPH